jgi:hypothetical protein
MRCIIFGDPNCTDLFEKAITAFEYADAIEDFIVGGDETPLDLLVRAWAKRHRRTVTVVASPNWKVRGKAAGPLHNRLMCELAHALVLIPNPDLPSRSKAYVSMLEEAKRFDLHVFVYRGEVSRAQARSSASGQQSAVSA